MNYYELMYLLEEFKTKFLNSWIEQAITPFKNQLELFIFNEKKRFRLIFNSSPVNSALFLGTLRPAKKSNTSYFFKSIYKLPIRSIFLEENERLISFVFDNDFKLWFKLYGSKANALLTKECIVQETFKNRDKIGSKISDFSSVVLLDKSKIKGVEKNRRLQHLLPIIPKSWINKLQQHHHLIDMDDVEIFSFAKKLDNELRNNAEFRTLKTGEFTLIPHHLLPESSICVFQSVNELILHRFKNYTQQQRLQSQKNRLTKLIKRQIKKLNSALTNLYKADKGIEKANKYEKYGHILMANAHLIPPKQHEIKLVDLYNNGEKVIIPINPKSSLAENAQRYYLKCSNSLKSYEQAVEKIPLIEQKLNKYKYLLKEIVSINEIRILNDWKKKNANQLLGLEQNTSSKQEPTSTFYLLDYKGYILWIGKNARSNDILVQKAHKEDIWLHARGVSGSHIIVRMNNSKMMPDTKIIEEIARFAAYQSKAKGAHLVPVIYTKRKYIRKPKGAAYGAVIVQKEHIVIVEPKDPFK